MNQWLLRIIGAACLLGIVSSLTGPKNAAGGLMKLIGGLYLLFVLIQPVASFDFDLLAEFADQQFSSGTLHAEAGRELSEKAMAEIIKQECESYIMDKASGLDVDLRVEVLLTEDEIPVPNGAVLYCAATPFQRERLERIMELDLNIPKENQKWIGTN